jgi:PAS domain S-box-containing protein
MGTPPNEGLIAPRSDWLVPKGLTGQAIAAFPWAGHPLGPLETWPPRLRQVVNFILEAGAPMAVVWGPEYRFIYNDGYAALVAEKHPAALGAPGIEIFPELWHVVLPLFERTRGGEAVLVDDLELPLTRGGVTQPGFFSFSYNPLRGERGQVEGFLVVVVETTARVTRERDRAQVFDTVLSTISDFAYTFDRKGRFTYINRALLDLWGLRLEEAVGKNFFELNYPAELAARLQAEIAQVFATGEGLTNTTPYTGADGREGWYEYIFRPVRGADGAVRTVAGSTRDISTYKRTEADLRAAREAAEQANQAKTSFLATLSHELRTPLNPVLLIATEAAANPDLPLPVRADFETIAANAALEAQLIDDLLDLTRITNGKIALHLAPTDINAVLSDALDKISDEISAKAQAVTFDLATPAPLVLGDPVRLQQVFWNLFRNATKFTPPGGQIRVASALAGTPPRLQVEVADTGIGMTAEEIGRLFNAFAQGNHTNSPGSGSFGGLGLGLALSRMLAELHGGTITAASAGPGRGSRFTVELPLCEREAASVPAGRAAPAAPGAAGSGRPLRLLLVEDHEPTRVAMRELLRRRRYEVADAASLAEARDLAARQAFDVLVSDIGLPDGDGYTLMRELKASSGIRGIALTGFGMKEDVERCRAAGFTTHLIKPVNVQTLDEALVLMLAPVPPA